MSFMVQSHILDAFSLYMYLCICIICIRIYVYVYVYVYFPRQGWTTWHLRLVCSPSSEASPAWLARPSMVSWTIFHPQTIENLTYIPRLGLQGHGAFIYHYVIYYYIFLEYMSQLMNYLVCFFFLFVPHPCRCEQV